MTDGIIQEVFNKYKPIRKHNGNYPYFTPKTFLELQQELIEKIKNKSSFDEYDNLTIDLKDLIGDNE